MTKRVSIWRQDCDPESSPTSGLLVEDRHPRLSEADAVRLVQYLNAGTLILRTTAMVPDPLSGSTTPQVRISQRTDGVWVWDDSVGYFAGKYRISPGEEFLEYVRQRDFLAPQLTPDHVAAVRAALGFDDES